MDVNYLGQQLQI